MRRNLVSTIVPIAAALVLVAQVPADAAVTYTATATSLSLISDTAGDGMQVSCVGSKVTVNSTAYNQPTCTGLQDLNVDAGAGSDTIDLQLVSAAAFPGLRNVTIDSGTDDDFDGIAGSQLGDLVHADEHDTVLAGGGDDTVSDAGDVAAGDGNDLVYAAAGKVLGGPGDDDIRNSFAGPIDGGAGFDTVAQLYADTTVDTWVVTDAAITSYDALNGNNSTPLASIERIRLGVLNDPGLARSVDARSFTGQLEMDGGPENDTVLAGVGGAMVDTGAGDDVVNLRDGVADQVVCGAGADTVYAEPGDHVDASCETVIGSNQSAANTGVQGPGRVRRGHRAVYLFSADQPGATYRCRVDHKAFRACAGKYILRTRKLSVGRHRLEVIAVVNGVADPTPAIRRFRVVRARH